jgi:transcriptional regulator with XRE-family HTH domain
LAAIWAADKLGKPQSFISEYERGQRRVDVVELLVIARALGIEPLDLFTEIVAALPK